MYYIGNKEKKMKKKLPILVGVLSISFIIGPNISYAEDQYLDDSNNKEIIIEEDTVSDENLLDLEFEEVEITSQKSSNYSESQSLDSLDSDEESDQTIDEEDSSENQDKEELASDSTIIEENKDQNFKEEDIFRYIKIDLDKLYMGDKVVDPGICRDVIDVGKQDEKSFKNKWVKVGDQIHYIDSKGKRLSGLHKFGDNSYYFGDKGLLRNDKLALNSGVYEFDDKGNATLLSKPKKGWLYLDDKTYYYDKRGQLLKGLQEVASNRYIFNPKTGQVEKNKISKINGNKYFSADNGHARKIGWDYYNGHFAYVKADGSYSKGLTSVSNRHYFFSQDGNMMTDTNQKVGNQWWYFDFFGEGRKTKGNFKKGWHGDYYYFKDGKRAQGYQWINGKLYYFDDRYYNKRKNFNGAFNFKTYYFDANGVGRFTGNISRKRHPSGTEGFKPGQSRNVGRFTPYYSQRDYRWAGRPFARSGSNFASMGCGSTAMAMALSRVKKDPGIYPTTIAKDAWHYTNIEGTEWEFIPDEAIRYGVKAHRVPINKIALSQALKEGPVVIRVGPGYFINAGHFMVLDSFNNGYFYLNDPYYWKNTANKHTFERLKGSTTTAWLIK